MTKRQIRVIQRTTNAPKLSIHYLGELLPVMASYVPYVVVDWLTLRSRGISYCCLYSNAVAVAVTLATTSCRQP